jgi:hypothetical protein
MRKEIRGRNLSGTPMSAVTYVQCNSGQVGWPDSARRVHKKSAGEASETVPNKIGG